jgi:hypothetical protein
VVVAYPTVLLTQTGRSVTGGTITTANGMTIHSFTSTGSSSLVVS